MRLVSLAPSCTEIVFVLGRGEWLVGRTAFCNYPPEATRIPAVGGWTSANVDAVVGLKPELVLTSTFLQDRIVDELRVRGVAVCHTDPRTLADVLASFEVIASALDVTARGRELRARVQSELSSLHPTPYPLHPRIYAEEWPTPPMASGNWVPDLLALADSTSLLQPGERSRTVTLDEVRAFDPDIVLLNYCGMAAVPAEYQVTQVTQRPGWETLLAIRAGHIIVLDDSLLNRPGPRLVEGAKQLQHVLSTAYAALSF